MDQNDTHRRYDPAMEMLCMVAPGYSPSLDRIVADLNLTNQRAIRPLVERLNETRTLNFKTENTGKVTGRVLRMARSDWPRVQRFANEYWDAVYADEATVIP